MKDLNAFDRLWKLAEAAINDLEKCEQDERYVIAMEYWHSPIRGLYAASEELSRVLDGRPKAKCLVCLAGSLMAKTLEAPIGEKMYPHAYNCGEDDAVKLASLDVFRCGDTGDALACFHGRCEFNSLPNDITEQFNGSGIRQSEPVTQYSHNAEEFKAQMRAIIAKLKAADL